MARAPPVSRHLSNLRVAISSENRFQARGIYGFFPVMLSTAAGIRTIDAGGKWVTPGLVAAVTDLGLADVGHIKQLIG